MEFCSEMAALVSANAQSKQLGNRKSTIWRRRHGFVMATAVVT